MTQSPLVSLTSSRVRVSYVSFFLFLLIPAYLILCVMDPGCHHQESGYSCHGYADLPHEERGNCQYSTGLLGYCFGFFFCPFYKKEKTLTCALRIFVFFFHIWILKCFLKESSPGFHYSACLSVYPGWLYGCRLFSLSALCEYAASWLFWESHWHSDNHLSPAWCFLVTKLTSLPLSLYLSSRCSPQSQRKRKS